MKQMISAVHLFCVDTRHKTDPSSEIANGKPGKKVKPSEFEGIDLGTHTLPER
jgi:hypothetical protein